MSEDKNKLLDEVELAETSYLTPYPNNPKKHPDEQVDKIAASIKEYGFVQPIVVDEDDTVVIGHGRLQAAKRLGLDQVPVIRVKHLSEAEVKALRLADNRVAESGWDDEALAVEFEGLEEAGFDMDLTGFDEDEISVSLDGQTEVEEDDYSEDPNEVETDIKEGEVFRLGSHRLMCGDATNEDHVALLMDGEKADMVFTDPPYGKGGYAGRSGKHKSVKNDEMPDKVIKEFYSVADAENAYYCLDFERIGLLYEARGIPKSLIVWKKPSFGMGNGYRRQHEFIAFYGEFDSTSESDVWEIGRDGDYEHPTQKPVGLPARAIKNSSQKGEVVLDVFGGSGSTLMAAEQTGRRCFMMELDPQYVQVIINRWEEYAGMEAEQVVSVE